MVHPSFGFRPALAVAWLGIALAALQSCGGNGAATHPVSSAAVEVKSTEEYDKRFLARAAELCYQQILLGKLATQRSLDQEIVTLARLLENANRDTKTSLGSVAIMQSLQSPSSPTASAQASYDEMSMIDLEIFDPAYLDKMVESHEAGIRFFETAMTAELHPDFKQIASTSLNDWRERLLHIQRVRMHMEPITEVLP